MRTRALLHAALLGECAERPLEEVTVADIVRRAGVGRTTFYLHYDELNELAADACAGLVGEAVDALHAWDPLPDPAHPPPELEQLFTSILHRAALYRSLLRRGGGGPLGELLHRELRQRSTAERLRRRPGGKADDLAASAVAAAFTGVLADWLHQQIRATPQELAVQLWKLLSTIHSTFR